MEVQAEERSQTAIGVLQQRFGEQLSTGKALREQHSHTTSYLGSQLPDAVLFATSTQDVQDAVNICREYRLPVIPFGTGTSLEGGVNAPFGGLSVDLSRMDRILQVNAEDLDCRVEAGVTREALNAHLRDSGLFFPIDPGANASLGGMAATRASGTNAVRYGTMRDNVLNLRAVMADGSVIDTAHRARKSSAGYDLTRLLVGSEGTLGLLTEVGLRLHGIPEAMAAAVCSFEDLTSACNATIMAMQMGVPMARIELMDAVSVRAVNAYSQTDIPESPLLLLEFHGSEASVAEQAETFGEIARECGGSQFRWVREAEERTKLWKARHDSYWAMKAWTPGKQSLTTDVCVPISRLAECVEETCRDLEESGLFGPIVGHVGDGNFHTLICFDPDDADEIARAEAASDRMAQRALAMEGTCTGEHGIGQGKRKFMAREHGQGWQVMGAIKRALDPDNILNPGKVVAET